MMPRFHAVLAALTLTLAAPMAQAQAVDLTFGDLSRRGISTSSQPTYHSWMSSEITGAWSAGFQGQFTRITVVDDFSSGTLRTGNLGTGSLTQRHGDWTLLEASLIAPSASLIAQDWNPNTSVRLSSSQLDTINLSYGMFAAAGYNSVLWGAQESSVIAYAQTGAAVVVKAAGNDAVAVNSANADGNVDYLNMYLTGAEAAIFVGALNRNGTVDQPAQLAWYSNYAGTDLTVQSQFLSVGVRGDLTGLYGTSYAAPIVSGYAAILGSKFRTALPTEIVGQLLDTARTDTILGYDPALHGRGEASIARALAPASIH
jgi:subtilisin family serine protease